MHHTFAARAICAATLTLSLTAVPAWADSTSSASSASSTSIGSSSASSEKSSNSSSTKDRVAQGQYTIVEMTELAEQTDMVRLRMQAVAGAAEVVLLLPRAATDRVQLAAGDRVSAEHRTYGLALATVDATTGTVPFFLILDDDWFRELESRPIGV